MKLKKARYFIAIIVVSLIVFTGSIISLIQGEVLAEMYDVIGIRIATLIVAFASFCSTSTFSYLVYQHNRTVSKANDDANKRAELFRELQFASTNYSIIDFKESMTLYRESNRYVEKFILNNILQYHMIDERYQAEDVMNNPANYKYFTLRIPFVIAEGKTVSNISFERIHFERNGLYYRFVPSPSMKEVSSFILYNEHTKTSHAIINLIVKKESSFFNPDIINDFSKIMMFLTITSILGVTVSGICELYFTNPEKKEEEGVNTYKINSSYFRVTQPPTISRLYHIDRD